MNKKKEYLVQVTVIEGRHLRSVDTTCDPFVKITVGNLPPQVTTVTKGSSSAVWNQSFTFTGLELSDNELASYEILIEVLDFNSFMANALVGAYSIGLETLYLNMNHEFYNTWLTLTNDRLNSRESTGYILVSCYIIGPNDQPPVHGINEIAFFDEDKDEFEGISDDELTPEQRKLRRSRKQNFAILDNPSILARGYQLSVNVAKAEDFPKLGMGSIDSFISVRCCGNILITPVVENTQKPTFNTKFQFPVQMPVLNDKIIVRAWDKRKGLSDLFIGNIPEKPNETDFFNVNSLQSRGGNMPFRWINLYGIPAEDRNSEIYKFFFGKGKMLEGTVYFGRVLMSMNLSPNENPNKGVYPLPTYREPPSLDYILRVDTYEVQQAYDCNDEVMIKASIGMESKESKWVNRAFTVKDGEKHEIKGVYIWKENKVQIEDIKVKFPADKTQVPDIFISLHTSAFFGDRRVAYLRIPVTDHSVHHAEPKWYPMQSVENQIDLTPYCFALMNIQFRVDNKKSTARIPKRRNIKCKYQFIIFLYAGYEIGPEFDSDEIQPLIQVILPPEKPFVPKKNDHRGKNPVWNEFICKEVNIDENLEFAPNLQIVIWNGQKNGMFDQDKIGEFSLPAMECKVIKNVLDYKLEPKLYTLKKNGEPQGRILASFTLQKNPKKGQAFQSKEHFVKKIKTDVEFSIIGIRNLVPAFKNPVIRLKIAGIDDAIKEVEIDKSKENDPKSSYSNPNYLQIVKFEDVSLSYDALYLPPLEVKVIDKNSSMQPKLFCTIPLIERAVWLRSQKVLEVLNIFGRIQGNDKKKKKEESDLNPHNLKKLEVLSSKGLDESGEKGKELEITTNKNDFNNADNDKDMDIDIEQLQELLERGADGNKKKKKKDDDESSMEEEIFEENVNFRLEQVESLDCLQADKDREGKERKKQIQELKNQLKELKADPKTPPEVSMKILQEIEKINDEFICDPERFAVSSDKMTDDYDYGRPKIKEPLENLLKLPYQTFELYKIVKFAKNISDNKGIMTSGIPTGSFIKGLLRVVNKDDTPEKGSRASRKSVTTCSVLYKNVDEDKDYPFDIFIDHVLESFGKPPNLKVRVYLYRGLHLAAQNDNTEIVNKLAGMNALCSADTYPSIKIGEGASSGFDVTKVIADKNNVIKQTLDPGYFRSYELDAIFPDDWKMEVSIMNSQTAWLDTLIGTTSVDLEDRFYGNSTNKQRLAYETHLKFCEKEITNLLATGGMNKNRAKIDELREKKNQILQEQESLEKNIETFVEYRSLKIPGKNISQGSVELAIEVLPLEISRLAPMSKIELPKPNEYEIRVIIYETFDVPIVNGDKVNIFVKCMFDPDGWTGDTFTKSTDTHMGSLDGYGIFNWRMKFELKVPCQFPRLTFAAYDMNTFSSDESIGECMISVRRLLKKLISEGRYEAISKEIPLTHASFPGKNRGRIRIGLQILSQAEARASPVGEAQEEPNQNPHLEKPKLGRGLGDFFKGGFFNFNLFGFLGMRCLKIFLGVAFSFLMTVILFIKPGILVK